MININNIEIKQHNLSYDKIIKNILMQSDKLTIRLINGLFYDDIPLDAPVDWLDKESVNEKYTGIVADFYPRIDGKIYGIEVENDGDGDMAIRVFRYTVGGAMLHGTTATKAELSITFPQPCVVFLTSTKNTPRSLTWNMDFFDGQKVTMKVPTIHLADLSVEEIARRNLLPIGQFYLRRFDILTKEKVEDFKTAAATLLAELRKAVENETVPYQAGIQMQDTIRKTMENVIIKSKQEVNFAMTTDIIETLPWIDYSEVFARVEELGRAEGRAEGKAEGRIEERATMVRALLKTMSAAEIAAATGLSLTEIEALAKDE